MLDGRRLPSSVTGGMTPTPTPSSCPSTSLPLRGAAAASPSPGRDPDQLARARCRRALSIDPSTPLSLAAGGSTTVTTTEHNDGPGSRQRGLTVSLSAPSGWTVKPASPVPAGDHQRWWLDDAVVDRDRPRRLRPHRSRRHCRRNAIVRAAPGSASRVSATEQGGANAGTAPAARRSPASSPSTPAPGDAVTLTGQNFGSTQGSSYLTLAQGSTSWGAPFDGAKLTITSWSDDSITFDLPAEQQAVPARARTGDDHGHRGRARRRPPRR